MMEVIVWKISVRKGGGGERDRNEREVVVGETKVCLSSLYSWTHLKHGIEICACLGQKECLQ